MAGKNLSGIQIARRISLGFFLVLVTVLTALHARLPGFPSIDGLCPFGGLETIWTFIAGGQLLKNIQPGNIVLLAGIVVLGIVVSRFFCGWICALGSLQGIFGWIGKKLFKRRYKLPAKVDSVLRYLKYLVLALILVLTWQAGTLIIRPYDPWAAYGHITAGIEELWGEFAIGLVILVASLVLSLFSDRVFCKYLCPLGAFNAILGRIPLFRIRREASTCTSCNLCNKKCPMSIPVATLETIKSPECIGCLECVSTCPTKQGTLRTFLAGKPVKVGLVAVLGLAIYLGAIAIGNLAGMGRFGPASLDELAAQGPLKVSDIKGSSTWGDVAKVFGLDLATLLRTAGLDPAKVPGPTKLKDTALVSGVSGFSTDTARYAVAALLGVEYAGEEGEGGSEGSQGDGQAPAAVTASPVQNSGPETLVVPGDFELEGAMTIAEVAQTLGTSPAQVLAKLGLPADAPVDQSLRDLKDLYGFKMPDLKERIHQ